MIYIYAHMNPVQGSISIWWSFCLFWSQDHKWKSWWLHEGALLVQFDIYIYIHMYTIIYWTTLYIYNRGSWLIYIYIYTYVILPPISRLIAIGNTMMGMVCDLFLLLLVLLLFFLLLFVVVSLFSRSTWICAFYVI